MSLATDLLEQADHLARRERKRPKQASLRRAVSAAYYGLFHLLHNPYYAGIVLYKGAYYQGKHEPLISRELFERVKDRREGRTRSRGGFGKDPYSRLFRCNCGHFLYPETPTSHTGTTCGSSWTTRSQALTSSARLSSAPIS